MNIFFYPKKNKKIKTSKILYIKKMKKILLFLLIPLIISDDMLKVKSTIDAGIDAIRQNVP